MIFAIELLVLIFAAGWGGFLLGRNWECNGSLHRYPTRGKKIETPRVIRVKVSSEAHAHSALMKESAIRALRRSGMMKVFGPLSISLGTAVFENERESEITITLHEGTTRNADSLWRILRGEAYGIAGVDCGRIYDRGKSWCAKVHANKLRKADGREPEFDCEFSPVTEY